MPIEIQGVKYYSPSEAAEKLNISTGMLKYYRVDGTVPGSLAIGIITYYSEEDLEVGRARVAMPKKRGPKKRGKKDTQQDGDGRKSSVTCRPSYNTLSLGASA